MNIHNYDQRYETARRYVEQSQLSAINGIKARIRKEESKLLPKKCPRCDMINTFDSRHCGKCGGILDLKYAMEMEEKQKEEVKVRSDSDKLMDMLLKDKDVQKVLMEKLVSMQVK